MLSPAQASDFFGQCRPPQSIVTNPGALKARLRYDAGVLYAMADIDFFNTFGLVLKGGFHDVALSLGVPLLAGSDFFLRLRLVGGGADVPNREIYNWGNFGGAFAGLRLDLPLLLAHR